MLLAAELKDKLPSQLLGEIRRGFGSHLGKIDEFAMKSLFFAKLPSHIRGILLTPCLRAQPIDELATMADTIVLQMRDSGSS